MSNVAKSEQFTRSIVVVEDDAFLRALLADSLEKAGFDVSTAASAADAKRIIRAVDPDAVVLDIDLGPGPNGFEIADNLRKASEDIAIVFLTSLPDPRFAGREEKSVYKNAAYLNKHLLSDTNTLVEALEAVLVERGVKSYRHHELADRPLAKLSRTQIQVLQLIAAGKTNQQIADLRKRSLAATESAVTRTLEALGVDAKAEQNVRVAAAMRYAGVVTSLTLS
jgi:DNA-binding NarL/FixJ family response regulator